MNRRTFIRDLGAGAAAISLRPALRTSGSRKLTRIGLELYAVRDAMRRDPEGTLATVRAIGYTEVELLWSMNNFGRTPQQVRAALDHEGLRAPSCHMAPETLLSDWEKSLDTAKLLGQEYLIVPSLPDETRTSLDAWRRWADRFNAAGAVARRAGLWLAFHNEPDHMRPIDGTIPYLLFLTRTESQFVRQQLDVGNMALGGSDPLFYLREYRDRYWSFHIKDVVADGSHDTELGKGRIDFGSLLAAIPDIDKKILYVEQEGAPDSLASARHNFQYLKELDF
jgi:sugar phosphate isomerase/epimerase